MFTKDKRSEIPEKECKSIDDATTDELFDHLDFTIELTNELFPTFGFPTTVIFIPSLVI